MSKLNDFVRSKLKREELSAEHPLPESAEAQPPASAAEGATPSAPSSTPMTQEQVALMMSFIEKMGEQNQQNLITAIQELKKPTPEEAAKLEKQRAKELREIQARIEVGKAEQRRRVAQQAVCLHRRPDDSWAVSGQEFSDGKARLMCLQCQHILYEGPTSDMFKQGIRHKVHITNPIPNPAFPN